MPASSISSQREITTAEFVYQLIAYACLQACTAGPPVLQGDIAGQDINRDRFRIRGIFRVGHCQRNTSPGSRRIEDVLHGLPGKRL